MGVKSYKLILPICPFIIVMSPIRGELQSLTILALKFERLTFATSYSVLFRIRDNDFTVISNSERYKPV